MYVNKKWLSGVTMPQSSSSYGVSEEIDDAIRNRLLRQIRHLIKQPIVKQNLHERLLGSFFRSGLYSNRHDIHDKTFKKMLTDLGCMKTAQEIAKTIGLLIRQGIGTFLDIYLARDLDHPKNNCLAITTGYLLLPDTSYYQGAGPGGSATLRSFETFLEKLGSHLGYEEFGRIANLEAQVVKPFDKGDASEPVMMTGRQIADKWKHVPWAEIWTGYGLGSTEWPKMRIQNRCWLWLKWLDDAFEKMLITDWINWLRVQITIYFAPLISSPVDDLFFGFFGRRLRGDKIKQSQEHLLYDIASRIMQPSMSYLYKSCCLSNAHQTLVRQFVQKIRSSAKKRIMEIDWMTEKSKKRTQEKIDNLDLEVADIDSGINYKAPIKLMSEIDIVHNICVLNASRTDRDIYYACHPKRQSPSGDAVYEVNAHYYNSGNRLVIPAGITLWPFYEDQIGKRPGWCFGGLGAVVGHEMLHAFDEDGKNYDEDGYFRPWWSKEDLKEYNKRANALVKLFGNTRYMGRFVNGRATLSENIADLGGLAIALDALKRHLDSEKITGHRREKELREFFISYATSWRTKERRTRSIYRLFTDVHAPAALRVNLIVAHFKEFYELFEVNPRDAFYIDPKDRITIF